MALAKILQVEDEKTISDMVERVLGMEATQVELARNFQEAMDALNGEGDYSGLSAYDALLLDMGFPGGNGADVAREARKGGFTGRIVMFSGRDMEDARTQTADIPNVGYIQKPVRDIFLIREALEGRYSE